MSAPNFRAVDQHSGDIAERPSKFFQALDEADERIEDTAVLREDVAARDEYMAHQDAHIARLVTRTAELNADAALTREAFAAAVGTYTCPCGDAFEFCEDSTLEEYAALNRWLGRHFCEEHDWAGPDEVDALHCRIDELTADVDDYAEIIMDLRNLNLRLVNENAALRQERDTLRAAVSGRTL